MNEIVKDIEQDVKDINAKIETDNADLLEVGDEPSSSFNHWNIENPKVSGVFICTVKDLHVARNVEMKKFQSDETEIVNTIEFLLEFQTDDCPDVERFATRQFKVSWSQKSKLMKFLAGVTGKPIQKGFKIPSIIGQSCQVNFEEKKSQKSDSKYTVINSVMPLPKGFKKK